MMFNWIVCDTEQYLEPFSCEQTITPRGPLHPEQLMLDSKACNQFNVCKQMINIE